MSSLGSVSKFSNLQRVGDSSIFGSKSYRISAAKEACERFFKKFKNLSVFEFWSGVLILNLAPTMFLRSPVLTLTATAEGANLI